jgi:Fic family protein
VNLACGIHYRLMRVFPFTRQTGKIARLLMNLVLLRAGFPPAVIHSTERQNYYEAIRDGYDCLLVIVERSLRDTMLSNIGAFEK